MINAIANIIKGPQSFPTINLLMNLQNLEVVNISGTNYFKDFGPLGLNALALTTTTTYDSLSLNLDSRLQDATNNAGCFAQFYNGTYPNATSAKTVLLTDLSQLYLDNYIFSNVTNKIFLIYSSEITGSALNVVLDRVEARISKMTKWGTTTTGAGIALSEMNGDNIFGFPVDYRDGIMVYNVTNKSSTSIQALTNLASTNLAPYSTITTAPNGHIIGFPYNETRLCDVDPIAKTCQLFGNFNNEYPSPTGQGRFNQSYDCNYTPILLNDGTILDIPRTPNVSYNHGVTKYNYSTNAIEVFANDVFSYISASVSNCCALIYISDTLIVAIPRGQTTVVNINPVAKTTESYGTLPAGNKYSNAIKISDDLIVCIPYSSGNILLVHPISKTIETFGSLVGTLLYTSGVLLPNGHIFCIPSSATQFLDIDPINKTYVLWGTGISGYYNRSYIILETGELLLYPYSWTGYLIKVDTNAQTVKNIKLFPNDFGLSYGNFGSNTPLPYKVSTNQIITVPDSYPNILDFDPITEKTYKLGWFPAITYAGTYVQDFELTNHLHSYNNRVFACKSSSAGIVDITLR